MKAPLLTTSFLLLISVFTNAQEFNVPDSLPTTREGFIKTEKNMIDAAAWLEKTPIGTDMDTRTRVNAWVTAWLINSPTVTIEMRASILKGFDKNAQLLSVYMAAYCRYCLQNNYSKDELRCNMAAMKAVINCYNLGGDVKKDKTLNKIIEKEKEGKLEDWVREALK